VKLYNTLARSVVPFEPLAPPTVTMYVCGPTVYDVPHIGHARSAYIFDVLRRYLEFRGFQVKFVRNVTDVDDKIIEKARQELGAGDLKAKCKEVAERYLASYHDTLTQLGIRDPDQEPRATDHVIPDAKHVDATQKIDASMTGFISQLMTKNMAYPAGGDVYFPVRKFVHYGKLSNRSLDDLKAGARIEPGEHKEDPLDFALWKAAKPDEPSWNSPWGQGRPGWHIECSVMSTAHLGDAFDIHGGGIDLIFPHHENEIAQAQAIGKPFARYWVHNGLVTVNGEKMSKSLGNFITVDQALKDCNDNNATDVLKIFFLSAHYRSPLNYMPAIIRACRQRYRAYRNLIDQAASDVWKAGAKEAEVLPERAKELRDDFFTALDDDLNTPQALSALDGMRSLGWQLEQRKAEFLLVARMLREHGKLLGLFEKLEPTTLSMQIDEVVNEWFERYKAARGSKDFKTSDALRKKIIERGFNVQDSSGESRLIPKRFIPKR